MVTVKGSPRAMVEGAVMPVMIAEVVVRRERVERAEAVVKRILAVCCGD